ncbi:MAG TPA: hypothetical protein P5138_00450 [Solirubrobacterales bacterium]|nr:hypothetical protein [Solirubrobacterales bacterium]
MTFLASIPAVLLYGPMLDDPEFILGAGELEGLPILLAIFGGTG